jgi:protein-disulfide isomerase
MREFCAKPEQYINTVNLPNGMDIHGAKPAKPTAVAPVAAPTQRKTPDPNTVYDIDVGTSPVRGPEDAPVTIVEFVDMQCPYCIREWPKLKQILSEYPQKVRLVFKHFPLSFHKKAKPAHAAMELALKQEGDDAFWKMHDLILRNPTKLDPNDLRGYAQTIELDMDVFDAVMGDPTKIDALIAPSLLEARKHGIRGTPTIFINGKRLFSRTMDAYKARIDEILNTPDAKE